MQKGLCALFLIGLLSLPERSTAADDVTHTVQKGFKSEQLEGKFMYLQTDRPLTIIPPALLNKFRPCPSAIPIFRERTKWHCVYFRLRADSSAPINVQLLIDTHSIDSVQVSVCDKRDCHIFPWESILDSTNLTLSETRRHLYPLQLIPGHDYVVAVNLINNVSLQRLRLPIVLVESSHYALFSFWRDLSKDVYVGTLLFVILFVFSLLLLFGERIYFYYLLYLIGLALFFVCRQNRIAYFTGPTYFFSCFWLIQWGAYTLMANGYAGFAVSFLNARLHSPSWLSSTFSWLRKLMLLMGPPFVFIVLVKRTDLLQLYAPLAIGVIALMLLSIWGLIGYAMRHRYPPAFLFALGYTPVALFALIIDPANETGYLGQTMLDVFYATHIFEIFILTLGLVLRFKAVFTDKERLQQEVNRQEQLRLETIIQVQEEERQRLAADLHDDLGATLSAIKGQLETVPHANETLIRPIGLMEKAIRDLRHISHNLMPPEFAKLGLTEVIRETVRRAETNSDIQFLFITHGQERRLTNEVELTMYRIALELINNAVKHAKAQQVTIQLIFYPNYVTLLVEDDGQGYSVSDQTNQSGIGLRTIRSRVTYLKSTLLVDSGERGTTITLNVPL